MSCSSPGRCPIALSVTVDEACSSCELRAFVVVADGEFNTVTNEVEIPLSHQAEVTGLFTQGLLASPTWWLWTDGPDSCLATYILSFIPGAVQDEGSGHPPAEVESVVFRVEARDVELVFQKFGVFLWSRSEEKDRVLHIVDTTVDDGLKSDSINGSCVSARILFVGGDQWPHVVTFLRETFASVSPAQPASTISDCSAAQPCAPSVFVVPTWNPHLMLHSGVHRTRPFAGAVIANLRFFDSTCPCTTFRAKVSLLAHLNFSYPPSSLSLLAALNSASARSVEGGGSLAFHRAAAVNALTGSDHQGAIRREFLRQEQLSLSVPAQGQREVLTSLVDELAVRFDALKILSEEDGRGDSRIGVPREKSLPSSLVTVEWEYTSSAVPLDNKILAIHLDVAATVSVPSWSRIIHAEPAWSVPVCALIVAEQQQPVQVGSAPPVTDLVALEEQQFTAPLVVEAEQSGSLVDEEYSHNTPGARGRMKTWQFMFHQVLFVDLSHAPLSTLLGMQRLIAQAVCLLVVDPEMRLPMLRHSICRRTHQEETRACVLRPGLVTVRPAVAESLVWQSQTDVWTSPLLPLLPPSVSLQETALRRHRNQSLPPSPASCACALLAASKQPFCESTGHVFCDVVLRCLLAVDEDDEEKAGIIKNILVSPPEVAVVLDQRAWFPLAAFNLAARRVAAFAGNSVSANTEEALYWLAFILPTDRRIAPCVRQQLVKLRAVEPLLSKDVVFDVD